MVSIVVMKQNCMMLQAVILDLDSTLLDAYGRQQPDFVSLYPYLSSFC